MKTKHCYKCKTDKLLSDFHKDKNRKDGYYPLCNECCKEDYRKHRVQRLKQKHEYHLKHRLRLCKKAREYNKKNKGKVSEARKLRKQKAPWKFTLFNIKSRCNNPKMTEYEAYGGRGIKCLITEEELKELWFRDRAWELDWPSIDRIDNDGNYEFSNCRYVEFRFNRKNKRQTNKSVIQLDSNGKIIKEWNSLTEASREFNVSVTAIYNAINHKRNTYFCKGFMWRYKND